MQKSTLQFDPSIEYFYLFDAKRDKARYFAIKEKYGYKLTTQERQTLQTEVAQEINKYKKYDIVVVPQSRGTFLTEMAALIAPKVIVAQKTSLDTLKEKLATQAFMKSEKAKLFAALDQMEHFVIHDIAGNQRKRFVEILFEEIDTTHFQFGETQNILLLDDSVFSGYTLQALDYQLKKALAYNHLEVSHDMRYDRLVLFSQQAQSFTS